MGLLELRQGEVVAGHEGLCGVVVRVEGEVGGVELVASVTQRILMLVVVGKALLLLDLG